MTIRQRIKYIIQQRKKKKAARKGGSESRKHIIYMVVNAALIITLLEVFGAKGFYGWLIITLVLAGWRLIKMWSFFMSVLRYIETMLWGKPLDKDLWDPGEFKTKRRRVKFVWKKKQE